MYGLSPGEWAYFSHGDIRSKPDSLSGAGRCFLEQDCSCFSLAFLRHREHASQGYVGSRRFGRDDALSERRLLTAHRRRSARRKKVSLYSPSKRSAMRRSPKPAEQITDPRRAWSYSHCGCTAQSWSSVDDVKGQGGAQQRLNRAGGPSALRARPHQTRRPLPLPLPTNVIPDRPEYSHRARHPFLRQERMIPTDFH